MRVSITIPEKLAKAIQSKGFDLETFIVEALENSLELDPNEELESRTAIAEYMLMRAKEELDKGDSIQASEKLYKAVEECVKVLACLEELEECRRAQREGQWWSKLLSKAARKLSIRLGMDLPRIAWEEAYDLHIHGFHEHALTVDEVRQSLPTVEKLVDYIKRRLAEHKGR